MPPKRLTRAESQALTVSRLIESADEVFTEKGYTSASVGEIAERAGYSKGAVYANFASKEDLFFAVQERRNSTWALGLFEAVVGAGSNADLVERVGRWHFDHLHTDVERFKVEGEYWVVAARHAELNERVAEAFRVGTDNAVALIEAEAEARGLELAVPADTIARILVAIIWGTQVQARFDPDLVDPDDFPSALAVLIGVDPPKPGRRRRMAGDRPDATRSRGRSANATRRR